MKLMHRQGSSTTQIYFNENLRFKMRNVINYNFTENQKEHTIIPFFMYTVIVFNGQIKYTKSHLKIIIKNQEERFFLMYSSPFLQEIIFNFLSINTTFPFHK